MKRLPEWSTFESEGEVKTPGEMTLDQLLDALEIVSQEIERSSNRANEANGAYVEHAAIRAELLARLNAGGSQGKIRPCALGCGGGDEIHDCRLDKGPKLAAEAGTSQPLQPSAVEGLRSYLLREYPWLHRLINEACAEKDGFEVISGFFSATPAMPTMVHMPPLGTTAGTHKLKEDAAAEISPEEVAGIGHAEASEPLQPAVIRGGTFEASPQLEQVARACAERVALLRPSYVRESNIEHWTPIFLAILQRHFPNSGLGPPLKEMTDLAEALMRCTNEHPDVAGRWRERIAVAREALKRLPGGEGAASPPVAAADFKTVNDCIEALNDAAELLKERHGSTGLDQSVALIIEQTIQRLKSIETEAAPLTPRKETVKSGSMVYVDNEKFTGYGIAMSGPSQRKSCISVWLENGNTWEYDAATVRNALPDEYHRAPRALCERFGPSPEEKGAEK